MGRNSKVGRRAVLIESLKGNLIYMYINREKCCSTRFNLIILIIYWVDLIESGEAFLFLWNKLGSRLHDKGVKCASWDSHQLRTAALFGASLFYLLQSRQQSAKKKKDILGTLVTHDKVSLLMCGGVLAFSISSPTAGSNVTSAFTSIEWQWIQWKLGGKRDKSIFSRAGNVSSQWWH